jgi:hypothetical protein
MLTAVLFISEDNAAVVFCLGIVVQRNGIGSAAMPKLLNELVPLLVGFQLQKRATFFRGNDVDGIS